MNVFDRIIQALGGYKDNSQNALTPSSVLRIAQKNNPSSVIAPPIQNPGTQLQPASQGVAAVPQQPVASIAQQPAPQSVTQPASKPAKTRAVSKGTPKALVQLIYDSAVKNGLDPVLFSAQLQQESGFNPTARSGAGAVGVAQFTPQTLKELERLGYGTVNPLDPNQAIPAAAFYLNNLANRLGDQGPASEKINRALLAYNAGPTTIKNAVAKAHAMGIVSPTIHDLVSNNLIPAETAGYIPKIQGYAQNQQTF
jgi:soluble lytic murein transglycosylase-like protein